MLILSAKLLLILFMPLAAVLAWKWRTRAAWRCALFALGALAVNFAVQLPIDRYFSELFIVLVGDPALGDGMRLYLLAHALAFGLVREGIRWLTFRYAATSVRSWNEGVLFGLGYSAFATLLTLGIYIHDDITVHVRMPFLDLPWRYLPKRVWYEGPPLMIFNVATSLAVLASVRRRQVWPFAAAILLWIITMMGPQFAAQYLPVFTLRELGAGVYPALHLPEILAALWLILHLRKSMGRDAKEQKTFGT